MGFSVLCTSGHPIGGELDDYFRRILYSKQHLLFEEHRRLYEAHRKAYEKHTDFPEQLNARFLDTSARLRRLSLALRSLT